MKADSMLKVNAIQGPPVSSSSVSDPDTQCLNSVKQAIVLEDSLFLGNATALPLLTPNSKIIFLKSQTRVNGKARNST